MYIQNVNLDVNAQPDANAKPCLRLSQNENGRVLMMRIIGVDIPEGSTANFAGLKPDGNVYSKPGTVDGNVVSIEEDIQMTAVSGSWNAKIAIVNDGNTICTARIRVVVDASLVPGDAIPSDSQLDGIVAECQAYAESAKSAAYGSPLTANTAADMTDQNRVYVYTGSETGYTAGHWYYYDGSAWTDGGVYNAVAVQTDTTLTQAGKAADAKETGDQITELKEDLNEVAEIKRNYFDFSQALTNKYIDGTIGSEYSINNASGYFAYIMPVTYGKSYVLRRTSYRWLEIDANGIVLERHGNSTGVNYLEVTPTNVNTVYIGFSWDTVQPANYMVLDTGISFDIYIPYPNNNTLKQDIIKNSAIITSSDFNISRANVILNEFDLKENFFDPSTAVTGKFIAGDVGGSIRLGDNSAYAYNLVPVEYGKTYILSKSDYARFEFDENMICLSRIGTQSDVGLDFEYTPLTLNVKYIGVSWVYSAVSPNAYMVTYKGVDRSTYIPYPNVMSSHIPYQEKEIYIGPNREYTSIIEAFKDYANDTDKKTFYIDSGEYDLYTEMGGAAFLQTIDVNTSYRDVCTFVPENSKVIGLGSVTMLYQPPAEDIPLDNAVSTISPLNVSGNAEIENITIICKNCRYAIHDEAGTNRRYDNTKKVYRRVRAIKQINDYVPTSSVISGQAFGCGFGSANEYLFEDCYFRSNVTAFSMHNNPTVKNYQGSNITLRNCVIDTDATQSIRFGSVWSQYPMENVINICNTYIKSRVTVTREASTNGARNTFNLTLLNCSDVEINDEFIVHDWESDYTIKVLNPIARS